MKTISLRTLLREPRRVKGITRSGNQVQVTDKGQPLWIIHPAATQEDDAHRRVEMEAELADVLRGHKSRLPLSKIILESRR